MITLQLFIIILLVKIRTEGRVVGSILPFVFKNFCTFVTYSNIDFY